MRLICVGHQRLYDLQSLASVFFPGENTFEGIPEVTSELVAHPQLGCRTVLRSEHDIWESFVACESMEDHAVRDAVKRSFFDVAVQYTRFTPSWGAFTGIRPAREYARMGLDAKAFAHVFSMSQDKAELCRDIIRVRKNIDIPSARRDVSLYVSIPFCPTRCAYCSFISGAGEKMLGLIPTYMETLESEIKTFAHLASDLDLSVKTVYIGGGTPATLTADQLWRLTALIRKEFGNDILEFTVELGRPDVITDEKLSAVYESGVDRICINPQTLNNNILTAIGRKHTTEQFYCAMEAAKKYPFKAVNCDLIVGLPGDTAAGFADSLEQVIALGAQNITVHSLCIKQGSEFKTNRADVSRYKTASEMVDHSVFRLKRADYQPYYIYKQKHAVGALENTGWAIRATESLYNMIMMDDLGTVIGVGAGSSSKIIGTKSPIRVYSPKYPYEYLRDCDKIEGKMTQIEQGLYKSWRDE